MKLNDFRGLFKSNSTQLINKENPAGDYYVFNFKIPSGLTWIPGEHGIFSFPDRKVKGKKWRGFSLASTPEEGVIKIGTKIVANPSDFKKHLLAMKAGDSIKIRGPFGWFKLPDKKGRLLFLAAGIGITPFRALSKQLDSNEDKNAAHLLYVSDEHVFRSEFESWGTTTDFLDSRDVFYQKIEEQLSRPDRAAYYYISGAPGMIKAVTAVLKKGGIKRRHIINDPFLGY